MKRILIVFAAFALAACLLTGCSKKADDSNTATTDTATQAATVFAEKSTEPEVEFKPVKSGETDNKKSGNSSDTSSDSGQSGSNGSQSDQQSGGNSDSGSGSQSQNGSSNSQGSAGGSQGGSSSKPQRATVPLSPKAVQTARKAV